MQIHVHNSGLINQTLFQPKSPFSKSNAIQSAFQVKISISSYENNSIIVYNKTEYENWNIDKTKYNSNKWKCC